MSWRTVEGFDAYEVSDAGQVRRGDRVLKPVPNSTGYPMVSLSQNGVRRRVLVHRLVAAAFIGDVRGKCVCHRDDDPTNSAAENLFIGTHGDNMRDMSDKGRSSNQRKMVCPRGHELKAPNLKPHRLGRRECLACSREKSRARSQGREFDSTHADQDFADIVATGGARLAGRSKTHCPQGHPLEAPNLRADTLRKGQRGCLACSRARAAAQHFGEPFTKDLADAKYAAIMGGAA